MNNFNPNPKTNKIIIITIMYNHIIQTFIQLSLFCHPLSSNVDFEQVLQHIYLTLLHFFYLNVNVFQPDSCHIEKVKTTLFFISL